MTDEILAAIRYLMKEKGLEYCEHCKEWYDPKIKKHSYCWD